MLLILPLNFFSSFLQQGLNVSIDDRLEEIASNIRTLDEWKRYIADYYPVFCGFLAKLEENEGGPLSCASTLTNLAISAVSCIFIYLSKSDNNDSSKILDKKWKV